MFVRVIATPPGEAPEEVRRAWLGLELPLAAGEKGARLCPGRGALTGPRTVLASLAALLTGRRVYVRGYVVDARQALVLLAERAPWAAQWWRECAPHWWLPGRKFLFAEEACAEVAGDAAARPSAAGRVPSERFFPAPTEVTPDPNRCPPRDGVVERPAARLEDAPWFRSEGVPESKRVSVRIVGWLAWVFPGYAALQGFSDLFGGRYGAAGTQAVALAVGLLLARGCWRAIPWFDRRDQTIPRSRQPDRGEVLLQLAVSLVFCAAGLGFAFAPAWYPRLKGYQISKAHFLQCVGGPAFYFLGGVHLVVALRRWPGSRFRTIEPPGPVGPDWLAGSHNVKVVEPGYGVLELRPVPRGVTSLADLWRMRFLHEPCASVRFDRNPGRPPRLFVRALPGVPFGRLPKAFRWPRPLQDVAAVELGGDAEGGAPSEARPTCRLCLRLHDANHSVLELAPRADPGWARATGERLARFLGVPLEDRTAVPPSGPPAARR